ncbi:hypothetical protein [Streptomyces albicerus]|uniref:hypothetical protein n=1 Tax=Streptomyces albicerus TaxID=2569859 RepID=UPI001788DCF9|nr:hypothetical protein [Streptomyces albicerus]
MSEQIAAALDAGQADGMPLRVQPVDGERFRLILVSATTGTEPAPCRWACPASPNPLTAAVGRDSASALPPHKR